MRRINFDDIVDDPPQKAFWTPVRRLVAVIGVALLLRLWAVLLLPTDFDEPIYVGAALDYARAIAAGDLDGVVNYSGNREHPALVKLLYAGVALVAGGANFVSTMIGARLLSALFGVLAVLVVIRCFGLLAGAMLAVHTLAVKYTSQAYLEAVPLFASIVAAAGFERAVRAAPAGRIARSPWFWASAFALGTTAASKFTYLMVGLVILYLTAVNWRAVWRWLPAYAAVALGSFYLLNPTLWPDPIGRLGDALFFHLRYSQGEDVAVVNYPWFQPLIWLLTSAASNWHPEVFFYFGFDTLICLLALGGVPAAWRNRDQRWLVIWLVGGVLFLLVWPTKWPQYALVVVPALCALAAPTLMRVYTWLHELESYWQWLPQLLPQPPRYTWIALALFVTFVLGIYAYGLISVTLGSIGWSHYDQANSFLPAAPVRDLQLLPDGRVAVATERGAALWEAPETTDMPADWRLLTSGATPLPDNRVLSLAAEPSGALWLGTSNGLARYDGVAWQTFSAGDLGLASAEVHALTFGGDGRLWAGTAGGATVYTPGAGWRPLPEATAGLRDELVLSVAVEPHPAGEVVWFGGVGGVSRLDTASGTWTRHDAAAGFDNAGVADLLLDSRGRLWAGTLGNGLALWEGEGWRWFNPANSDLPSSEVNALIEARPGEIWVATAIPLNVGGSMSSFNGEEWRAYLPRNSGFSGEEPVTLAVDATGRLWIGTRGSQIDLYQLP